MPLEIRRKPDGTLKSKYWYGSFTVNGKRRVQKLGVEILGTAPKSLRDLGDPAFERSRGVAQEKLEGFVRDARGAKSSEALVQQLHELKYGAKIEAFPIENLVSAWKSMPKKRRTINARYAKDVIATLDRFLVFVQENHPHVKDASQVDRRIAREFMESEEARGIADKTWNDSLKRLRATFKFLQTEYGLWRNPFDGIRMREEQHQHRKPLTGKQVKALLATVKDNDFSRPLIVCALSTAMRLGDCCHLKWRDVDLDEEKPSVTVKTSKTGETVCIPVYERLRSELELAAGGRKKLTGFVWPEQAALYAKNHCLVSRRLRRVFKRAFGEDEIRVEREHGMLRASICDFHSLRTTWITEALSRGVPIETVKLVSGHKTVEVVTTHYFHPDRDQVRNALQNALPEHLTGGNGKQKQLPAANESKGGEGDGVGPSEWLEQALGALRGVTGKANQAKAAEAVEMILKAKAWYDGNVVREAGEDGENATTAALAHQR